MRALIVDDEGPARRELRRLLAPFSWVQIVGECANVSEARAAIEELAPELLFLDIQMPGGSGFDLLAQLEHLPQVIFTTAHDEHAVRAFEVDALDYLLKPIEPARLAHALARVREADAAPGVEAARSDPRSADGNDPAGLQHPLQQLFVRDGGHCWFVPLRDVRLLSAEGNYVRLSWGTREPLLGRSLAALEPRLDPAAFFRANRRQIINLHFIEQVEIGSGGRLHVELRGGPEVEISRRQARMFKARGS
jgi:two-component system LytT family response regulator